MEIKQLWPRNMTLIIVLVMIVSSLSFAQDDNVPTTTKQPAAAQKAAAIPMLTGTDLTTYKPSAVEILTPPDSFTGDIRIAKTPPVFDFGILPGQWGGGLLWSSWGEPAFSNGKFYASIGDHDGHYGNALVYEVDPQQKKMERVVVFNDAAGLKDKSKYAPGKIHSPIMDGGDGWLYFFGYRGRFRQTGSDVGYVGDPLVRYNPVTRATENLGPVIPDNSVAASAIHAPSRTVYVLGNYGLTAAEKRDQFYAYNLDIRKMVFKGGLEPNIARSLMVAPDGRVYYSTKKPGSGENGVPPAGILACYNPKTNAVTLTDDRVPGDGKLRAASRANSQGVIYAFSNDGVIFSYDTKTEQIKEITKATFAGPGYTTSCILAPTARYLYYAPGAHGGSVKHGTAIFQLDTHTGERKILGFFNSYLRKQLGYNLGGTFGIALSDDGSQLFICWNGRPIGAKNNDFGQSSVMVIHIPEAERGA